MSDILIYGQTTARLPSAYQEVEYLQASGTQYIDTGFIPTNDTLEIEYVAQKSSSADAIILGVDNTNITNALNINEYGTTDLYARLRGSSSSTKLTVPTSFYNKHTIKISNTDVYYDDTSIGTITTTTSLSTNTSSLRIFGRTGTTSYLYHGKLYSLIYKENNVKELELVPCYRKSDSIAGLYDLVNSVFYTNAGSGTFTVGPDIDYGYSTKTVTKSVLYLVGSQAATVTIIDESATFYIDYVDTSSYEWESIYDESGGSGTSFNCKVGDVVYLSSTDTEEYEATGCTLITPPVWVDSHSSFLIDTTNASFTILCFIAGSKITMSDGSQKNIEDIITGDKVIGYNGSDYVSVDVLRTFKHNYTGRIYKVSYAEGVFEATSNHPIYVDGEYKRVDKLKVGDNLLVNGKNSPITNIEIYNVENIKVYNFDVSDTNNYIVNFCLAHNKPS